ncbi:hypothetical protein B0T22DRAFT_494104 [Podospora appendiculata]|uniref:Uncharacterized protein n=1 Tax=Podospora appendiculata TaxID=314037 RepID=A0AAE0X0X2_9PEZI|nr:hypothetical protein B0T22DRAFT_494104 [Podospora appendiculata]
MAPPNQSWKVYNKHRVGSRQTLRDTLRPLQPVTPPARSSPPRTEALFRLRSMTRGATPANFNDANNATRGSNPDRPQPPATTFDPSVAHHHQHAARTVRPPPLFNQSSGSTRPIRPVLHHRHEFHGRRARSPSPTLSETPSRSGSAESLVPPATTQPRGMQSVALQAFLAMRKGNQPPTRSSNVPPPKPAPAATAGSLPSAVAPQWLAAYPGPDAWNTQLLPSHRPLDSQLRAPDPRSHNHSSSARPPAYSLPSISEVLKAPELAPELAPPPDQRPTTQPTDHPSAPRFTGPLLPPILGTHTQSSPPYPPTTPSHTQPPPPYPAGHSPEYIAGWTAAASNISTEMGVIKTRLEALLADAPEHMREQVEGIRNVIAAVETVMSGGAHASARKSLVITIPLP